jgi:hypothetical protein
MVSDVGKHAEKRARGRKIAQLAYVSKIINLINFFNFFKFKEVKGVKEVKGLPIRARTHETPRRAA